MTPGHWRIRETTFVRRFFFLTSDGWNLGWNKDLQPLDRFETRCCETMRGKFPQEFSSKSEKAVWCLESLVDIEIWATIKYTGSIHDKGTPFFRLATFGRKPEALPEKAAERQKLMGCTALWLNPVVKQRRCKLRILVWGPVECWLVGFP